MSKTGARTQIEENSAAFVRNANSKRVDASSKPAEHEQAIDIDLVSNNPRSHEDIEMLGLLAMESRQKAQLPENQSQRQAVSRFTIGALLLTDPILDALRREIRRLSADVRIETEDIRDVLVSEILKNEILIGEKAVIARKHVAKAAGNTI